MGVDEPIVKGLAELGTLELSARHTCVSRGPEDQWVRQPSVGIKPQSPVGCRLLEVSQIHAYSRRRGSRTTRGSSEISRNPGIIKFLLFKGECLAPTHCLQPAFKLIEGNVDAGFKKCPETSLDSLTPDQPLNIAELTAGVAQELSIRALGILENPPPQLVEKQTFSVAEINADGLTSGFKCKRFPQKVLQPKEQ
jgi:hypothetical protein